MTLFLLTRIPLFLYGLGCLAGLLRLIGLQFADKPPTFADVGTVFGFPFLLMTVVGRKKLSTTLNFGETK